MNQVDIFAVTLRSLSRHKVIKLPVLLAVPSQALRGTVRNDLILWVLLVRNGKNSNSHV